MRCHTCKLICNQMLRARGLQSPSRGYMKRETCVFTIDNMINVSIYIGSQGKHVKLPHTVHEFFNSVRKHIQNCKLVMNREHMIISQRIYAYSPGTTQLYLCTIQQIYASYNEI